MCQIYIIFDETLCFYKLYIDTVRNLIVSP